MNAIQWAGIIILGIVAFVALSDLVHWASRRFFAHRTPLKVRHDQPGPPDDVPAGRDQSPDHQG